MSNFLKPQKLTVYTQDNCPYCLIMKKKLLSWGYNFEEINVSYDMDAKMFLKENKHRTVPQVYFEGRHLNKVDTEVFTKRLLEKELFWEIENDGGVEMFG